MDLSDTAMESSMREKFIRKSLKRENQNTIESNMSPFEFIGFLKGIGSQEMRPERVSKDITIFSSI
jgi:hypothetical protein